MRSEPAIGNGAPTAAAGRTRQRGLDREDEFPRLGQLGLEDADIGDVERNQDNRSLGIRYHPSYQARVMTRFCTTRARGATPRFRGTHGKSRRTRNKRPTTADEQPTQNLAARCSSLVGKATLRR
jgi:hypothetical protein